MPIIEYEIDTLDIIRAAVASIREPAPLEPMLRSHEMVERITTKEYPYKLTLMDEETQDSHLAEFGAACTELPSNAPQQGWYRSYRKGH
jgi:hypothetical protein